jgi:hypothetical protein
MFGARDPVKAQRSARETPEFGTQMQADHTSFHVFFDVSSTTTHFLAQLL